MPGKAVGGQRTSTFCPYLCRTPLGAEGCGDRSAEELDRSDAELKAGQSEAWGTLSDI